MRQCSGQCCNPVVVLVVFGRPAVSCIPQRQFGVGWFVIVIC